MLFQTVVTFYLASTLLALVKCFQVSNFFMILHIRRSASIRTEFALVKHAFMHILLVIFENTIFIVPFGALVT